MDEVEFKPDQEVIEPVESIERDRAGLVTKIFIKLSFGKISTNEQANVIMVIVAIIAFGTSIYLFYTNL